MFWVLCYLNLSSVLFWHQSGTKRGLPPWVCLVGMEVQVLQLGWGGGVLCYCCQRWEFRFPIRPPLIPALWLEERGAPHYCSPDASGTALGGGGWKSWFSTSPFLTPPWQGWLESLLTGKVAVQVSHVVYTDTAEGDGMGSSSQALCWWG